MKSLRIFSLYVTVDIYLVIYPGVIDSYHDFINTHEKPHKDEETGGHHPLQSKDKCAFI